MSSGADPGYNPQPTSYDYDAPISEPGLLLFSYEWKPTHECLSICEGDITSKFMAIRSVIGKYLPLPPDPVPKNNTKKAYGTVQLSFVSFIQIKN